MENEFKVCDAWICQVKGGHVKPFFGDIIVKDGIIVGMERKNLSDFLNVGKTNSSKVYNACGRFLTIPQINFHEHIYSRLAKGLNISGQTNNFENILKNLWWKLDSILDKKMIEASAKMTAIESIKSGTTYLFDHHSSPNFTDGSLNVIANILNDNNLRSVLCFETTDRNGKILSKSGIKENLKFAASTVQNQNIKNMFGLHASFTLDEETLKSVSNHIAENNLGIHIHLSEDEADNKISKTKYGLNPIERLIKYNLINEKSILSHAVNLSVHDWNKIKKYNAAIAINPESNMNNSVGLNRFESIPDGIKLLCGTDGMHANPSQTLKSIFLLMRHQGISFEASFRKIIKIYFDQIDFVKKYYPDFSLLNTGERADFIVWDYVPPTPVSETNFWGHFIYGVLNRRVASVFHEGKVLMKEFQIAADEEKINKEIFLQGKRLFNKFNKVRK